VVGFAAAEGEEIAEEGWVSATADVENPLP
jgi:hypothetical protein